MKKLIIIPFLLFIFSAFSQETAEKKIPPELLKQDFKELYEKIKEVHINPYANTSKDVFDKTYDSIQKTLNDSLTSNTFYAKIVPFFTLLHDGHSEIMLPEGSQFETTDKVFPIMVKIINGKIYIKEDLSNIKIKTGSEIVKIGMIPSLDFIKAARPYFDGEKESFVDELISQKFNGFLGSRDAFTISYVLPSSGDTIVANLPGIPLDKYQERIMELSGKIYKFSIISGNIAYLKINAFLDANGFSHFIDSVINIVNTKKIGHLIIDERNCPGGYSSIADTLICHITDKPYRLCSETEIKLSKAVLVDKELRKDIVTEQNIPDHKLDSMKDSIITLKNNYDSSRITGDSRFTGKIYLLTGKITFSTAVAFAGAIKDCKLGTIIGEETGGLATSYGPSIPFTLPNSGINYFLSYQRVVRPSGADDGKGVIPDYIVKQTQESIINNEDAALQFTIKLINSMQDKK